MSSLGYAATVVRHGERASTLQRPAGGHLRARAAPLPRFSGYSLSPGYLSLRYAAGIVARVERRPKVCIFGGAQMSGRPLARGTPTSSRPSPKTYSVVYWQHRRLMSSRTGFDSLRCTNGPSPYRCLITPKASGRNSVTNPLPRANSLGMWGKGIRRRPQGGLPLARTWLSYVSLLLFTSIGSGPDKEGRRPLVKRGLTTRRQCTRGTNGRLTVERTLAS